MGKIVESERLKIARMIRFGLWEEMQADRDFGNQLEDQTVKIEEQITEMKDLIGYKRPPKFKLIKGGLE
ncbi:hypothetical protein KAR91_67760 [Candidatus Pacearchaeota archaeon]|nr:hypothetical protein [Candidatus Pacearchaeota archaeon]